MFLPLLATNIVPTDRHIEYVGRFDRLGSEGVVCQWPASDVRFRVRGKTLSARIDEKGQDFWQLVVDGKPAQVVALTPGTNSYTFDLGSNSIHLVDLVKRTEPFVGTTTFKEFNVPDGKILMASAKKRRIQFVGDSITCGFGNEGSNQTEPFSAKTENAYMSYASIAGRSVDADVELISWSGRTMWPTNSMPEIYDRILPTQATPAYDFSGPPPNAIVINLATNDFGRANPDETQWTNAYEAFIRRLWGHYPKASVYVTLGGMMSDDYPAGHRALSTLRGYLQRMLSRMDDHRLHLVEFDQQKMEDGIGSSWHPNIKTDQKMATRLIDAWHKDLGW